MDFAKKWKPEAMVWEPTYLDVLILIKIKRQTMS